MSAIVIDIGFGDSGKGLVTDYLCKEALKEGKHPLVIRFSGGQQCGHNVVLSDGTSHIFSNFGSGTLRGVPTYWSKYCTFDPAGTVNEYKALLTKGISPILFVDPLSPVTTIYDIAFNRALEDSKKHGSCGLGFAATVERNLGPHKLYVKDLKYPQILIQKLKDIRYYYSNEMMSTTPKTKYDHIQISLDKYLKEADEQYEMFIKYCTECAEDIIYIVNDLNEILFSLSKGLGPKLIFEGSQGVLLDQDHGIFPNVTRSYTTSKNAIEILNNCERFFRSSSCSEAMERQIKRPDIYYVSRAYQTRHGNGWMSNELSDEEVNRLFINERKETNILNRWQGKFRIGLLDIDLLQYAINTDLIYSGNQIWTKNIVITCLDHFSDKVEYINKNGNMISISKNTMSSKSFFNEIIEEQINSDGEISENIFAYISKSNISDNLIQIF